jgi:hypothetical protein
LTEDNKVVAPHPQNLTTRYFNAPFILEVCGEGAKEEFLVVLTGGKLEIHGERKVLLPFLS